MTYIIYILKILYYFAFVFLLYGLAKNASYQRRIIFSAGGLALGQKDNEHRMLLRSVLFLCVLVGIYGIICGTVPYSADRGNYALRFANDGYLMNVKSNSVGLYWIEVVLHLFTYDPRWLFFTIPFLSLLLTLIAYNKIPETTPESLLFLGLSSYYVFSFYAFKQAPAVAFVALAFAFFFKGKKLSSALFLAVAICFHESSWIMLPVFIAMVGFKSKAIRGLTYSCLLASVLFFPQVSRYVTNIVSSVSGMDAQISGYLDETGAIREHLNYLTAVKGVPYYFISVVALIKRPVLKGRIDNYDKYLLLSCFTSVTVLLSTFMYWMWRFGTYCYFPVFVFASLIYREMDSFREKQQFKYCLGFLLGFFTLRSLCQYYFIYGGIG